MSAAIAATAIALPGSSPPTSGAPPGAPPGAQPFHRALEDELARTAPAEGQHRKSSEGLEPRGERHRREDGSSAGTASGESAGTVLLASTSLPSGSPAPVPETGEEAATAAPKLVAPEPAVSLASELGLVGESPPAAKAQSPASSDRSESVRPDEQDGRAAYAEEALPGASATARDASAGTSVARQRDAQATVPVGDEARASTSTLASRSATANTSTQAAPVVAQTSTPAPGQDTMSGQPPRVQAPSRGASADPTAELADQSSTGGSEQGRSVAQASQVGATSPTVSTEARHESTASATTSQGDASDPRTTRSVGTAQPTVTPGSHSQPVVVTTTPPQSEALSETGFTGDAPLVQSGVGMQEMIESIHATIGLAIRQGISQARIALQPAELGEIRVHLSQSADGLIARVTADTPAAAQALAGGRAELHHSLSTLGTSLLRLEIGSSANPDARQQREAGDTAGSTGRRERTATQETNVDLDEPAGDPTRSAPATTALGELVDVLA